MRYDVFLIFQAHMGSGGVAVTREEVYSGSIDYLQVLDADGNLDEGLEPDLSDDELLDLYYHMVLGREFDRKAISLQRRGELGTYTPLKGQEAAQAGSALPLEETDLFVPSYREHIVNMMRDVPLEKSFLQWGGDERGFHKSGKNAPESVPVASQLIHAAGFQYGEQLDENDTAAIAYCGDGSTSQGAFHSGLNWASALDLPVVFFVQNNSWAISTPWNEQSGSETVAQKSLAYGMDGIRVDGNDVLAVYAATEEALERAREEQKPALIEAVTYRREHHTTADDATRYRSEEELEEWRRKDPIQRFETYLEENGLIAERLMENGEFREDKENVPIYQEAKKAVETAVEDYTQMDDQAVADLFDHQFAGALPSDLEQQKLEMQERYGGEER